MQNMFYSVNPNGALRWSLKLGGKVGYAANIGNDNTIYVAADDCNLYAITPEGKIKWKSNLEAVPGNGPAISPDGTIYVVAGEFLQAFDPDGTRRLKVDCSELGPLSGLLIDNFESIYVTGENPRVRVISNSGVQRWEYEFPDDFGKPLLPGLGTDGSVYFASSQSGEIFVLNPDGTKRWSRTPAAAKFLTELALDDANQLYMVNENKGLMAITSTGQMLWNLREVNCQLSPAFGADGTIYIASDKKLYAIGSRAPKLTVDTATLDWGQICAGGMATRALKITNIGSSDLRVNNIFVSSVSFQVEAANFILPPGAQRSVQVSFSPTDFVAYAGILTINTDAGNVTVALKGAGIGAKIAAVSESLQFGDVVIGKTVTQLAQIASAGACEVRIDSAKTTGAYSVAATIFPITLTRNDTAKIAVRLLPTVSGGQQATLLVYNNDKQRNPLVITLTGNGVPTRPEIEVSPLTLEFGKSCDAVQAYTIVTNLGEGLLRVDSLVFSNTAFATKHAKSFTVAAGKRDTIRVQFQPVAGAESKGALMIFNDDVDERSVQVKLSAAGGAPDIAGVNEIDFGVVNVQTCAGLANFSTRPYAIRNDGSCELRIDSLIVSGVFSLAAPFSSPKIPAGGNLSVALKFMPAITGDQTGKLRIVSNDAETRSLIISLRGRGVAAPDIAITGDTLDFGAVPAGNQKLATIKIRNDGELNLNVTSLAVSSPRFIVAARQLALACKQDSAVAIAFAPDSMGVFTATLSIRSNDPNETVVSIFLRGRGTKSVQALIATDAAEYRFPALCLGSRDSLRAVITNSGNALLRVDSLRVQSNQLDLSSPTRQIFSLATAGFSLQPEQSKTLWIFFKPARRAEYIATVQIFSNAGNNKILAFGLRGSGSGPEISGRNAMVFASTKKDSARRDSYLVNNLGDCSLNLTSMKIEGEHANDFKVLDDGAKVIAPRSSSAMTLEFKPTSASLRQAKLVILSSDPTQPRLEIALTGSGSGAPGKLAGPVSIDFGEACFDEKIIRECTLINTGESDFKIIRLITIKGEFFKINDAIQLPRLLRPQEAISIALAFSPKKSGAVEDTLLAQTDLVNTSLLRVVLKGDGSQDMARLVFSHKALAFNGHLDEAKTELMTIANNGCSRIEINQIELARKLRVFAIRPQTPLPVKLEPTQSLNVQVSFKGDDFRAFADSLYIYCVDWQQNRERLSVSLLGKVMDGAPCLQTSFSKLDFGEVAVGQVKRLDLEVTNCSDDSRIVVRALQPVNSDFKVLRDTLTIFPRNPQFFAVNFAPRQNGEIVDTLKLVYYSFSDPGRQQTERIALRGAATGNRAFAMPNAFTPNGDGKNDAAKIHFAGYDPAALVLRVYDLRGLEVRLLRPERRSEFEINWDGRDDRGAMQMPGAYLWLLENDGKKIASGQLVLIR
jgi:outer membrane protein assembly factor BamB